MMRGGDINLSTEPVRLVIPPLFKDTFQQISVPLLFNGTGEKPDTIRKGVFSWFMMY